MTAGRSCPLSYRYSPTMFRAPAAAETEVLYVVGGLYGNRSALEAVLDLFAAEHGRKHLIFNGDFHWFDIEPDIFRRIDETVLSFDAIRGNVETELGGRDTDDDAGCGCAYPDWVDDGVVQRSNAIMRRLAATAANFPSLQQRMAALPMWRRIDVGGVPVGVVHGDAQSLAGWGFAPEHLRQAACRAQAREWFDLAQVRIFACSHTCSPVFQAIVNAQGRRCLVANNGAAGMPNFADTQEGLLTRVAVTPCEAQASRYGTRVGDLYVDALSIRYDAVCWHSDFLRQWPPGSPAHASYWNRISAGPSYRLQQALAST